MDKQLQTNLTDTLPIVAEQKKVKKLEGRIVPRPGHTTYEYNYVTKALGLPIEKESNVILNKVGRSTLQRKMEAKTDCVYFQALNELNAWKKIFQMGIINDQEYLRNVMKIKTKKNKT